MPLGQAPHAPPQLQQGIEAAPPGRRFPARFHPPQPRTEQAPNRPLQGRLARGVLQHDHRGSHRSGRGGVGLLVAVGCGGEGHQDRRGAGHGQFAEAAGPGAADH